METPITERRRRTNAVAPTTTLAPSSEASLSALVARGMDVPAIVAETGMDEATVRQRLQELGLTEVVEPAPAEDAMASSTPSDDAAAEPTTVTAAGAAEASAAVVEPPKRRRGRPRKSEAQPAAAAGEAPKRRRGRPPKAATQAEALVVPPVKRGPGRPRKQPVAAPSLNLETMSLLIQIGQAATAAGMTLPQRLEQLQAVLNLARTLGILR